MAVRHFNSLSQSSPASIAAQSASKFSLKDVGSDGDGFIYLAAGTLPVRCLKTNDLSVSWEYALPADVDNIFSVSADDDGNVYGAGEDGSNEGVVIKLNSSGVRDWRWTSAVGTTQGLDIHYTPSGDVIAGFREDVNDGIRAFNAATGSVETTFDAVGDGSVLKCDSSGRIVFYSSGLLIRSDIARTEVTHTVSVNGEQVNGLAIGAGEIVFVGSQDGHAYSYSSDLSTLRWSNTTSLPLGTDGYDAASIGPDGHPVFVGNKGQIIKLDKDDGSEIWKVIPGASSTGGVAGIAIGPSGTVYASVGSFIHKLRSSDGALLLTSENLGQIYKVCHPLENKIAGLI